MMKTQDKIYKDFLVSVDPVTKKPRPKDPKYKQYLLLIFYKDSDEKTFEIFGGREDIREYLAENSDDIDLEKSLVLVEDVNLKDAITVIEFLVHIKDIYFDERQSKLNHLIDQNTDEKNELLFKKVLISNNKKNYSSTQEIQGANLVEESDDFSTEDQQIQSDFKDSYHGGDNVDNFPKESDSEDI